MKALIICKSVHHGNTRKIADAMARALGAELVEPENVTAERIAGYDLIGFGSGIYRFRMHPSLFKLIGSFPGIPTKAFIFSTAGGLFMNRAHAQLREKLEEKGLEVVGEFNCPGFDTFGLLALIGGVHKGRPNEKDLAAAREFAVSHLKG